MKEYDDTFKKMKETMKNKFTEITKGMENEKEGETGTTEVEGVKNETEELEDEDGGDGNYTMVGVLFVLILACVGVVLLRRHYKKKSLEGGNDRETTYGEVVSEM
jgi:hypothetical protein